jgi:hypothetical protein
LKGVVNEYRKINKKMVASILGRKPNYKLQFNADKIAAIKIGIEDNPKIKALDEARFCFVPPSGKWTKGNYNLATRC